MRDLEALNAPLVGTPVVLRRGGTPRPPAGRASRGYSPRLGVGFQPELTTPPLLNRVNMPPPWHLTLGLFMLIMLREPKVPPTDV